MPEVARMVTTDAEIDAAIRRGRAFAKYDQRVTRVVYSQRTDKILLNLSNGVTQGIPRRLLQGLSEAEPSALDKIELLGHGTGLYWPELDVAHLVSGLLAGVYGSAEWMKQLELGLNSFRATLGSEKFGRSAMATGLDGRHRDKNGRIDEKRGDTLVRTLRKEYGEDFLRGRRSDTKLSTVRKDTDMSLTELVRQHRREKK